MKILVENCKMYTILPCGNPNTLIFTICTIVDNERERTGTGSSISRALSDEFLKLFFPVSQPGRNKLLFI